MQIKPIRNHVIFQFVDKVNNKAQFEPSKTEAGIILSSSFDDSAKIPRWANVIAVGPLCKKVKPGQQILLPALRWTTAVKFNNENIWRTDEEQVVATRPSANKKMTPLNSYVIFTEDKVSVQQYGSLYVVGVVDNTATGNVITLDPKCERKLFGAKIYFSTDNFFDRFEHDGKKYSFIKEENILVFEPLED